MKTKLRVGIIINESEERNKLNDLFRISKLSADYEIILINVDYETNQKNNQNEKKSKFFVRTSFPRTFCFLKTSLFNSIWFFKILF